MGNTDTTKYINTTVQEFLKWRLKLQGERKRDKNMCWRPEYLLKGFLKSETERGLKWRNEGFCMRQLSFTQTKLPRKTIPKKSLFWPMVSEFWSVVTNLYRCGPMKADDRGSECMWQRGLFTSGRRKQGREGKGRKAESPPPEVSTTSHHHHMWATKPLAHDLWGTFQIQIP